MKPLSAQNRAVAKACRMQNYGEWSMASLVAANLAWTALCLGGVRAETKLWSWALTGAALVLNLICLASRGVRPHPASWVFVPFMICAALNLALVTPVRWLGAQDWLHWAQVCAVFFVALNGLRNQAPRRLVLGTVGVLGVVAVGMACYQFGANPEWLMMGRAQAGQYVGRASGFFGNPNSLAAFLVLLLPVTLAFAWRRGFDLTRKLACAYLAGAFVIGLALTMSRGGLIAFALALVCWPWFVHAWGVRRRALTFFAVLFATTLGAAALWVCMPPVRERLQDLSRNRGENSRLILWEASLQMTEESPLMGTGAGSFNVVFEKHRPEGFRDEPEWTHNEYLNILCDYGAAGFALFFGGVAALAFFGRSRLRLLRHMVSDDLVARAAFARSLGVGLGALGFACFVDFHLHIPAIAMTAAIFAAEYVKRREELAQAERELVFDTKTLAAAAGTMNPFYDTRRGERIARISFYGAAVCVVLFVCLVAVPIHRAEAARAGGRELLDRLAARKSGNNDGASVRDSLSLLRKAVRIDACNADALSDLAYALALLSRIEPAREHALGAEAEAAAREAIEESPIVAEFWIRLGVALDLQGRRADAGDAFAKSLKLAPANALAWYHYAYHLSLTPSTRGLALGAVDTCLRLDPGYEDADILRAHLNAAH